MPFLFAVLCCSVLCCVVLCCAVASWSQDEKAVSGQLDEVFDKGWMVFSEAGEGQKGGYFSSLQDFRQHAVTKQLVGMMLVNFICFGASMQCYSSGTVCCWRWK